MNVTPDLLRQVTDGMASSVVQPKAADVASLCDIAGVDPTQAIILLKKWPNWQDAVAHYFDDPSGSLREDTSARQWEPADLPYAEDVRMSRPPSPAGKFIDLTDVHAEATRESRSDQEFEDDQLKQAMAESMKNVSDQENGTTGAGQYFGPARRPDYPDPQWSMVATSREVVEHPPAPKRRRVLGQPAFLRSALQDSYIAPLLTIYHSIPLARYALLFPPLDIFSYGHNCDWWAGTTDENSKPLSMHESSPAAGDRKIYLAEIQCLMAFLDSTSRAYGSVDALSELRFYRYLQSRSDHTTFIEAWQQAAMNEAPDDPLTQIFTSVAARGPGVSGASPEAKPVFQIEGAVRGAQTQIEVLDKIVWTDSWREPLDDVWVETFGHVLTMRLFSDDAAASALGVLPTEVWYLDRYTPEFREKTVQMRHQRLTLLREIEKLNQVQLNIMETPGNRGNASRLNTRKALETARDLLPIAADETLRSEQQLVDLPQTDDIDPQHLQARIDLLLAEVGQNLKRLGQRKAELDAQIRTVMSDFTYPDRSSVPLRQKYVLQGVTTKSNVTYIRKLNRDLIGMQEDDEPFEVWQWWRTVWGESDEQEPGAVQGPRNNVATIPSETDGAAPFSVRKVSAQEVLEAVRSEHTAAILVYADEIAMNYQATPLTPALQKFVEQDNRVFEDEISLHNVQHSGRTRRWSNETNSTVMDDNPFDDTTFPSEGREMTPMSTSTVRSASGQPSPKRPRSSEDSMQTVDLIDKPPSYDTIVVGEQPQMSEKKGNRIGYFAEQLLQNVEQNEQKS